MFVICLIVRLRPRLNAICDAYVSRSVALSPSQPASLTCMGEEFAAECQDDRPQQVRICGDDKTDEPKHTWLFLPVIEVYGARCFRTPRPSSCGAVLSVSLRHNGDRAQGLGFGLSEHCHERLRPKKQLYPAPAATARSFALTESPVAPHARKGSLARQMDTRVRQAARGEAV